jgi:hypothetical protein
VALPRLVSLSGDADLEVLSDPVGLANIALGSDLASLLDLGKPIDALIVTSDGPVRFAVSLPVANVAAFTRGSATAWLSPLERGRFLIAAPTKGRASIRCELWHVADPIGFRVLCGSDLVTLNSEGPVLLGRLSKRAVKGDFRIELPKSLVEATLSRVPAVDSTEGTASYRAGHQLGREWMRTLLAADAVGVEAKLGEPDIDLSVELAYRDLSLAPELAAWLRASAQGPQLSPEFWRLPADSAFGFAFAGVDEPTAHATLEPMLSRVEQDFGQSLGPAPLPKAAIHDWVEVLRALLPNQGRFVVAVGRLPLPIAASARPNPKSVLGAGSAPTDRSGDWIAFGLAADPVRYRDAVERLLTLYRERPESTTASTASAASATSAPRPPDFLLTRVPKLPAGLPAGSELLRYGAVAPPKAGGKPLPPDDVLIVPSSGWVWILVSASDATLVPLAQRLLTASADDSLASRDELTPLAAGAPAVLGTLSFAGLLAWGDDAAGRGASRAATLPFGGTSRLPVRIVSEASGDALSLKIWSRLSPTALADLRALIDS